MTITSPRFNKSLVSVLLTALLGYTISLFGPWWAFTLTSFTTAFFIIQAPGRAALCGFAGLFLLWGAQAWLINSANAHILASKTALLLNLGSQGNSGIQLVIITAITGGVLSAMAALTGSLARKAFGN